MDRLVGRVAVVTGASAGIGLITAESLVRHGMIVIGLARRKTAMEERMKHVQGKGAFHAIECDISKEENVVEAFNTIKNNFKSVHILINNAGLMNKGKATVGDSKIVEQTISVNILGLHYCTKQAVKLMKENNNEGHIVNIGSILGHKVLYVEGIDLNIYPATKFAVRAFTETLQNELRGTQIRVTHISPGVVKTEFFDVGGANPEFLNENAGLNSEDVADAIIYAISRKPSVQIADISIRHSNDYFY